MELGHLGDKRGSASFLPTVLGGPEAWEANETIRRAIEIRDGFVQIENILAFQDRKPEYPHVLAHPAGA